MQPWETIKDDWAPSRFLTCILGRKIWTYLWAWWLSFVVLRPIVLSSNANVISGLYPSSWSRNPKVFFILLVWLGCTVSLLVQLLWPRRRALLFARIAIPPAYRPPLGWRIFILSVPAIALVVLLEPLG